ncbi:MAG: MBOAT family protein [Gammaproteobacteria bacterium]|nr:MBOAT family protein [Gammaproteobacteria bacterium]
MLFNSEIFLFLFLPLTLLVFYLLGHFGKIKLALASLVIASLLYYGWWKPIYLPLILGSMTVNYGLGYLIQKLQRSGATGKATLVVGIVFNLGLLGYFKYANFFVDNLNALSGDDWKLAPILLPLAISFFTFQQIAYLVDVHQKKAQEVDLLRYALFVTFFPQLIAGPIVHHSEMMPQFANKNIGRFQLANLITGGMIFAIGLFKKVVLADNIAPYATAVFNASAEGNSVPFVDAWTGVLAYTFQIYFDFSGYSDMAIGLGRMVGICLPLNFNSPYKATGIIDFWRRWHMTLSRFLRDYLYIPLGGNRMGPSRRYVNMITVMLLGGLWHGAGWNFVIWGALHGVYLGVNHAWRSWRGDKISHGAWARGGSRLLTFLAVILAWVFFRASSIDSALNIISGMLGMSGGIPLTPADLLAAVDREAAVLIAVLVGIAWYAPNTQQFMRDYINLDSADKYRVDKSTPLTRWLRWSPSLRSSIALALLTAITVMSLWQPSEFIYYQF